MKMLATFEDADGAATRMEVAMWSTEPTLLNISLRTDRVMSIDLTPDDEALLWSVLNERSQARAAERLKHTP